MLLLQITETAATETVRSMSLWNLCLQGGWTMIPLAALLLLSIYVTIERAIILHKASRTDDTFMKRISGYIHESEIESALNLCKATPTPYARLIAKGISRIGRPMNDVLVAIENTGNLEVAKLSKGLPLLATTAAGAPMIGFLVAGLIVGIAALFAYNFLVARVNKIMNQLEARTMEFMDLLNEPSE